MIRRTFLALMMIAIVGQAHAQESTAARKQAGSWFFDTHDSSLDPATLARLQDSYLNRMTAVSPGDIGVLEAALKHASLTASYQGLVFALPNFKPLFNSKDELLAGAVARYAKRLEQVPAKAVGEWEALAGRDQLTAAISLTAEDALFPGEKFSDLAFRALVAKFK